MLQELRFRICNTATDMPIMLHEGKLAQEFGVSRTPVRQVLQRLSFERLLETRSGVGTVVTALDPLQRDLHFSMLSDMLRLCRRCCRTDHSMPARMQIAAVVELSANPGSDRLASYFAIRTQLLELTSGLVEDPIVAEALSALHWRVIRWHMQAARADLDTAFRALSGVVTRLAATSSPADLLECLAAEAAPRA
jgi:DNA-binding GntR family transcriptional regulator